MIGYARIADVGCLVGQLPRPQGGGGRYGSSLSRYALVIVLASRFSLVTWAEAGKEGERDGGREVGREGNILRVSYSRYVAIGNGRLINRWQHSGEN